VPTACNTIAVTFQSVFPQPHYNPFIIAEITQQSLLRDTEGETEGATHIVSSIFTAGYIESLNAESEQLQTGFIDTHKSQVPPWLTSSGIARFLQNAIKGNVYSLLAELQLHDRIPFKTINEAVYQCMQRTIKVIRPGEKESRLSRVARRHLGSFEPGRMQIKPFTPVQEDLTVNRSWGHLITVLLRMQTQEWQERFDLQYFDLADDIIWELYTVRLRAEELFVEDENVCHLQAEDEL